MAGKEWPDRKGTDIILHINARFKRRNFKQSKDSGDASKYCRFLPVPIKFWNKTDSEPDGVAG